MSLSASLLRLSLVARRGAGESAPGSARFARPEIAGGRHCHRQPEPVGLEPAGQARQRGIPFVVTEDESGGGCCSRLTGPDAEPESEYPLRFGGNGARTNRGIPSGRGYCGSPGIRLFNMPQHTLIRKCGFLTESVGHQYSNMGHNPAINTEFNAYFTQNYS